MCMCLYCVTAICISSILCFRRYPCDEPVSSSDCHQCVSELPSLHQHVRAVHVGGCQCIHIHRRITGRVHLCRCFAAHLHLHWQWDRRCTGGELRFSHLTHLCYCLFSLRAFPPHLVANRRAMHALHWDYEASSFSIKLFPHDLSHPLPMHSIIEAILFWMSMGAALEVVLARVHSYMSVRVVDVVGMLISCSYSAAGGHRCGNTDSRLRHRRCQCAACERQLHHCGCSPASVADRSRHRSSDDVRKQ